MLVPAHFGIWMNMHMYFHEIMNGIPLVFWSVPLMVETKTALLWGAAGN
jgi:hypothetical protein